MNNGINLVVKRVDPKQQKIQRQNKRIRLIGFGFLGLFTFASVVLFIFLQTSPITSLRQDQEALSLSLNAENQKIQNEVLIDRQLTHVNEILAKRTDLPDVVSKILQVMPSGVSVTSYQAASGNIELSIESSSLSQLETFLDTVTELATNGDVYGSVTISGISYNPTGTYTFGMTITK